MKMGLRIQRRKVRQRIITQKTIGLKKAIPNTLPEILIWIWCANIIEQESKEGYKTISSLHSVSTFHSMTDLISTMSK